jgi:ESCRT-II complex subunit VPS36
MALESLFKKCKLQDQTIQWIPQERVLFEIDQVGLYENNNKLPDYDNGKLQLTTHRILFAPFGNIESTVEIGLDRIRNITTQSGFLRSSPKIVLTLGPIPLDEPETAWKCTICNFDNVGGSKCVQCGVKSKNEVEGLKCPVCTFLNHLEMSRCEMCDSELLTNTNVEYTVKISFRNGGQPEMLPFLEQSLKDKQWLLKSDSVRMQGQGVSAVLSNLELKQDLTKQTIQTSFQDLDQLMKQAHEVTQLVQSMLSKVGSPNQDNEFQQQLWKLGLIQPVSRTSGSDYHKQLSAEVLLFLKKYASSKQIKVLALSDLYCLFNRARSTSFVSPQDLYKATALLQPSDEFCTRTFSSGVIVLESREFRDDSFIQNHLNWLEKYEKCTPLEMAKHYNCSVMVGKEILLSLEQKGLLCRDDTIYGLSFYRNRFLDQ